MILRLRRRIGSPAGAFPEFECLCETICEDHKRVCLALLVLIQESSLHTGPQPNSFLIITRTQQPRVEEQDYPAGIHRFPQLGPSNVESAWADC
jgi:hypothetical protein